MITDSLDGYAVARDDDRPGKWLVYLIPVTESGTRERARVTLVSGIPTQKLALSVARSMYTVQAQTINLKEEMEDHTRALRVSRATRPGPVTDGWCPQCERIVDKMHGFLLWHETYAELAYDTFGRAKGDMCSGAGTPALPIPDTNVREREILKATEEHLARPTHGDRSMSLVDQENDRRDTFTTVLTN